MIVILIPPGLSSGVVSSQVLILAKHLSLKKEVVVLVSEKHHSLLQQGNYNFEAYKYSQKKAIKNVLRKAHWIYIRSFPQFLEFYFKRKYGSLKYKLFYDFRGLVHDESYLRNKSKLRRTLLFWIEKFIAKNADHLGTVSYNFEKYLKTVFKTTVPVTVTPCAIEKVIEKKKRDTSEIKFVYMGGLSAWQCFEDILRLYKKVSQQITNTSLTVITRDKEIAFQEVKKLSLKNVFIKSLSHEEVIMDLPNYDFGFLIRENRLLNQVASPIKFLEYTSNGVIPIITKGIGDFSDKVKEKKIGIILKRTEEDLSIKQLYILLDDAEIYKKLYNFSTQYTWHQALKNYPLVN